jgi:DNA polymerase III epsilon subunit-like protein
MLHRDFEGYERSHELVKLSDGRYTCNRCRLQWKRRPKTFCAGVPVYRYGTWPDGLYTYTQLRRELSMKPLNREEPQGCYFLRKSPYRRWLYHVDQSVHRRVPTGPQREAIAKMRAGLVRRYTCAHCGYYDYTHGQGRYKTKVDRVSLLCDSCERLKYRREKQALVAQWAHDYLEMVEFVVVDSETTGLNEYKGDEIIELAIVHSSGVVLFSSLIQTQDPGRVDMATHIHGITQQMLSEAPTFPEVWPTIRGILRRYRKILVYNAPFDHDLLDTTAARYGYRVPWASWTCLMDEYAVYYGAWHSYWQSYTWQKLKVACRDLGVEVHGPDHRALPDALSALGVLKALAALHGHIKLLPLYRVPTEEREASDLGDLADHPF